MACSPSLTNLLLASINFVLYWCVISPIALFWNIFPQRQGCVGGGARILATDRKKGEKHLTKSTFQPVGHIFELKFQPANGFVINYKHGRSSRKANTIFWISPGDGISLTHGRTLLVLKMFSKEKEQSVILKCLAEAKRKIWWYSKISIKTRSEIMSNITLRSILAFLCCYCPSASF